MPNDKIEQLERKVKELEEKLALKLNKEQLEEELDNALSNYDKVIRSDDGRVFLKQNATIRNRKGIYDWADSVLSINFNRQLEGKQNQIQIGMDRDEDDFNKEILKTNAIFIHSVMDDFPWTGLAKFANGAISIGSISEDRESAGVLNIYDRRNLDGQKGIMSFLCGGGENGIAGIGNTMKTPAGFINAVCFHTENDSATASVYKQHIKQFVDIYPQVNEGGFRPSLGRADNKYDNVHTINIHTGDITFENGWKLTESYKASIKEEGLAIVNKDNKVVAFIGNDGIKNYANS